MFNEELEETIENMEFNGTVEEATFLLNLMNKGNLTKRMYKNELKKDKERFNAYQEYIRERSWLDDLDEYPF